MIAAQLAKKWNISRSAIRNAILAAGLPTGRVNYEDDQAEQIERILFTKKQNVQSATSTLEERIAKLEEQLLFQKRVNEAVALELHKHANHLFNMNRNIRSLAQEMKKFRIEFIEDIRHIYEQVLVVYYMVFPRTDPNHQWHQKGDTPPFVHTITKQQAEAQRQFGDDAASLEQAMQIAEDFENGVPLNPSTALKKVS